jgi:hypothetical protein
MPDIALRAPLAVLVNDFDSKTRFLSIGADGEVRRNA